MTTLAALRQATLNILYGLDDFEAPLEDRINGAIANGTTETVAFDTGMWQADDYAEYQDNGEITRLVSTTVQKRGQRGTTAASHLDNTDVLRNPPFYQHQVETQIEAVVRNELWPKVWTWHKDSLSASETEFRYPLDEFVDEVVVVYQDDVESDGKVIFLPPGWWDTERQLHTDVVTDGGALILKRTFSYDETVYYTAKRRPHVDDLANLSDELADMIPFAAAARCIAFRSPQVKQAKHKSESGSESTLMQDYRALRAEFILQRDNLMRLLHEEVRPDVRHRPITRTFRRTW